jgi:hypothetical protein
MKRNPLFTIVAVVALVTMACGVNFNLPLNQVKTGPTQTDEITVEAPAGTEEVELTLEFGAGELNLSPGTGDTLVSGTAVYNVADFKPEVASDGSQVSITQGDLDISGIPTFNEEIENTWDLQLGSQPLSLVIRAGAYNGEYQLGGLALTSVDINDGAADVSLEFSEPNTVEMSRFEYSTGASDVSLSGLANANFEEMVFRSGAGSYILDFSGELQRDASVNIESGISTVTIRVPAGVQAEMTFEGGLSDVDIQGYWVKNGDVYNHPGEGPVIRILVEMGAGNVELETR